ncbi:hypothetical protein HUT18_12520 [Streptomyces sp. NA04227]|uniref:hypothetical protein n=1 Tax=Streptomyces sp. NA04227 TaxID=2742136 RepID=UPI0015917D98|nr:hypothetical protein [Streptomyces sp. NA04227]QKW07101.1 hypothetical protein HUT18_12520 [Streptomyces sp. NA04227]
MIKNHMRGFAPVIVACTAVASLAVASAQAAAPKTFGAENTPIKHQWSLADHEVTLYFGMKNLQGEVTMQKKALQFLTESEQVRILDQQGRTFEVPAEVSMDNGRTWKRSSNSGLNCTLGNHPGYQVVDCDNTNTTRWEKNSILRWGLPVALVATKTADDVHVGTLRMAFEATSGWSKQEYAAPEMRATANITG